jgi:hypothetical protein
VNNVKIGFVEDFEMASDRFGHKCPEVRSATARNILWLHCSCCQVSCGALIRDAVRKRRTGSVHQDLCSVKVQLEVAWPQGLGTRGGSEGLWSS